MSALSRLASLLLMLLASACVPQRSIKVEPADRRPPPAATAVSPDYRVERGDTLYGIAFRHGMDYRELATLNGIAAPYTIYPGQRLRLRAQPAAATDQPATATRTAPPAASKPAAAPTRGVVASVVDDAPRPAASTPPGKPSQPAATPPTAPAVAPPPQADAAPAATLPTAPPRWQWPTDGALIATFLAGDPTRQGINLGGEAGDPVRAAADGVVVYSGSGLIGYGELVIVKHNETWLSAYGHNRKRLVKEGEAVKAGQRVAEMGRSGASRDMLHFEVRKNGKPVDPLGVLPKR